MLTFRELMVKSSKTEAQLREAFGPGRAEPAERNSVEQMIGSVTRLSELSQGYLALAAAGRQDELVKRFYTEYDPLEDAALAQADATAAMIERSSIEQGQVASAASEISKLTMLTAAPLVLCLSAIVGWLTLRAIVAVVGGEPADVQAVIRRIAAGDLSGNVTLRGGDDRSILALMKAMQDQLGAIIAGVRNGVDSVGTASAQIASGSQHLRPIRWSG